MLNLTAYTVVELSHIEGLAEVTLRQQIKKGEFVKVSFFSWYWKNTKKIARFLDRKTSDFYKNFIKNDFVDNVNFENMENSAKIWGYRENKKNKIKKHAGMYKK